MLNLKYEGEWYRIKKISGGGQNVVTIPTHRGSIGAQPPGVFRAVTHRLSDAERTMTPKEQPGFLKPIPRPPMTSNVSIKEL